MDTQQSDWLRKELDSINGSALRLALLDIIQMFQERGGVYGYKISNQLLEHTEGEFDATNATFYAILRRLEKDGLIHSRVQPSDVGPPRKHYFLTATGEAAIEALHNQWERNHYFLNALRKRARGDQHD